jgi:hypothetical protein
MLKRRLYGPGISILALQKGLFQMQLLGGILNMGILLV